MVCRFPPLCSRGIAGGLVRSGLAEQVVAYLHRVAIACHLVTELAIGAEVVGYQGSELLLTLP